MDYFFVKKKLPSLYIKKNDVDKFAKIIESNIYKNRAPDASSSHVAEEDSLESKRKRLENLKAKAQALKEAASEIIEIKKTESQLIPAQEGTGKILNDNRASLIQERAKQIIALQNQKKIQLSEADKAAQEKKRKLEAEKRRAAIAMQIEKSLTADLESIQEMGNKLGFTPEVQTITKKSVAKTIEAVRNAPKLSALLLQIRKEKDKYISAHSMLLAYISCALATKMEWSSETTYQKLTLAAFLHDAHLINHELAKIETLSELEKKMNLFSPEEIKAFKEHPIIAAEIARKFHEVPPDVDSIVAQHHERPDGSGFPRGLSHTRIGPLTSVFIVAHDIVSYLFKNDKVDQGNVSFNQFILENQGMYQFGNFKKVLLAVPKIQT
jgi:HD-GYP domain-containing protein (c-di-GMP phosphodiesterase class II)